VIDKAFREKGLDYLNAHFDKFPQVAMARVARVFQVYRPFQGIEFDDFFERRAAAVAAGARHVLVMTPFALYGIWLLRKRKIPISPFRRVFVIVGAHHRGQPGHHPLPRRRRRGSCRSSRQSRSMRVWLRWRGRARSRPRSSRCRASRRCRSRDMTTTDVEAAAQPDPEPKPERRHATAAR
jgi:hypothetical protein